MKICKNPTKHNPTEIAKTMVAGYPKSLQDVIDDDVIGLGYHSLVKQLKSGIEIVKRPGTPKIRKREASSDDNDTDKIPAEQKVFKTHMAALAGSQNICHSQTVESQLEKKKK